MITAYLKQTDQTPQMIVTNNPSELMNATWIDLLNPTKEEEALLEKLLDFDIPTREEMQEIEPSNRLYKEKGSIFMTMTMVAKSDSPAPKSDAVTLIIKEDRLITVRYIEPHAFALFISRLPKIPVEEFDAVHLIIELLEASIDRLADIFERVGHVLDDYSQTIFRAQSTDKVASKLDYKQILVGIGANGDLNTKAWESLMSLNRLSVFYSHVAKLDADVESRLTLLTKDIKALSDQVQFLTTKVNFLLDATLGMVNIEQNNIIKIFSIAAVILLPPTLVASIYGMNFDFMPELKWHLGYPFAIVLMAISAWLPYKYFKAKKWL